MGEEGKIKILRETKRQSGISCLLLLFPLFLVLFVPRKPKPGLGFTKSGYFYPQRSLYPVDKMYWLEYILSAG